ncbi:GNAT family N-acetyltransferase [Atopobacter sp. AH10]|uniref:GNAT family N-acetyltransferase n=1 Tax=Atopobacter sp. AH10 TaxID=2315861 RepID=UPI000EF1A8CF|nr:GNAT family N-acetyltransferase [Atopobacter sp. AH10]RLK63917.1 GNAT family N-acetyltransferase [Atopobacter sp. AH10]
MIDLRAITEENFSECIALTPPCINEDHVDSVLYSLAEAWLYYEYIEPYAVYSDNNLIGFVSLYTGERNYQIINFYIDEKHRCKGIGSKVVTMCLKYLKYKYGADRVSAPVALSNNGARSFWRKMGFVDSSNIEDGYIYVRRIY